MFYSFEAVVVVTLALNGDGINGNNDAFVGRAGLVLKLLVSVR